jgi:hypothetical protein
LLRVINKREEAERSQDRVPLGFLISLFAPNIVCLLSRSLIYRLAAI